MKISLFFLSVMLSAWSFGQKDSLLAFEPNREYTQQYIDSIIKSPKFPYALEDFEKVLRSDKQLKGWIYHYNRQMTISIRHEAYDSAFYFAELAKKTFEESHVKRDFDEALLIRTYNLHAYAYTRTKNFPDAITNYYKAVDLAKKHGYKWVSYLVAGIARSHFEMGNKDLALKSYLSVLNDTVYMNLDRPAIATYTNIAGLYLELEKKDSAVYFVRKGIKRSLDSDFKDNLASFYGYMGYMHFESNQDSAKYYFNKAIATNNQYGLGNFAEAAVDDIFSRSYLNFYNGNTSQAIKGFNAILDSANTYDRLTKTNREVFLKSIEMLGIIYAQSENPNAYKVLLKKQADFLNRFHTDQISAELNKLEIDYQTKQKDASIAQLEANKSQQEKIITQQRVIAFGLGGLLILLSGLGYLFWRQRRLKNRFEKEVLEQRLLRSQMNPHFIGNSMSTISALVQKKSEQAIPYVNQLSNLFRQVLTNSREEFVTLDDEIALLKNYLEIQSESSTKFDFEFAIDDTIDKEEVIVPPMLIQPLIENAIVHGLGDLKERGVIKVNITKNEANGLLSCEVKDNGKGYQENVIRNTKAKSVSGTIIRERLNILKKKFKVNTGLFIDRLDPGTKATLHLPYLLDS